MAKREQILEQSLLDLLVAEDDGLTVAEIVDRLRVGDGNVSEKVVRAQLNKLAEAGKLNKQKRRGKGRGKTAYAYFHSDELPQQPIPRQLNLFDQITGVSNKSRLIPRTEVEKEELELEPEELKRQEQARSVLEKIASSHLQSESYAQAIVEIAPQLAEETPVELVVEMAAWVVKDLNQLGEQINRRWQSGNIEEVKKLASRLEERLIWARSYFQRFWRLDRSVDEIPGILNLPGQAKYFFQGKQRAFLNEEKAREKLGKRILGDKVIEERVPPTNMHKAAAGTDASVADILLDHSPGSFIPPDPVVVTTSAAAMVVTADSGGKLEYQDFDIFPDHLQEYEDFRAAENGLVLSPDLMRSIGKNSDFKHSRTAAMDLRQYSQDLHVSMDESKWRPIGNIPELGINSRPTLIFRDGRVLPIVHRLNFYEDKGLYGKIVRNLIKKFADVIHNTLSSTRGKIVYGSAVKNPELSWLAPLVFWYLHIKQVKLAGKVVVDDDDVYKAPLADTAVSQLLFLGLAKKNRNFERERVFLTFQPLRRFSDIVFLDESLPLVISEKDQNRLLEEDSTDDWNKWFAERILRKQKERQENILDKNDYQALIYACDNAGVIMCYAAPTSAYQRIVASDSGAAGQFLIPRLEAAVNLQDKPNSYQKNLDEMLSWLAAEHWALDRHHTQSGFDTGNSQQGIPILVPDVTILAHEAATFARDKLSQEVKDQIRELIAELRKRMGKSR